MTLVNSSPEPFSVLIVGGGVAALEAALALRELGGDRIATTILAPDPEFVYRPMTVREPFGYAEARRYPLDGSRATSTSSCTTTASNGWSLSGASCTPRTGEQLSYDALLLALGARSTTRYKHALTVDDAPPRRAAPRPDPGRRGRLRAQLAFDPLRPWHGRCRSTSSR